MGRQLGIRWQEDRRASFDALARRFKRDSADLARIVLEEFMSCFSTYEEHVQMGMPEIWGHHGMLELARREGANQKPPERALPPDFRKPIGKKG